MATLTAQIIVGRTHPNHGGISPTHYLFFSENDRPAWILVPENVFAKRTTDTEKTVWIPTVEHALEDGLLMVALHILKDREIVDLSEKYFANKGVDRAELYRDIDQERLAELHEKTRSVRGRHKVVITTFRDSLLEQQLTALRHYDMDLEACVPVYSRMYSQWRGGTTIEGSLD